MGIDTAVQSVQRKRVIYLDTARGITILLIVAFHVLGETYMVFHDFVASMCLEMFLFVSGYFFRGFDWKKNLQKLVLPYGMLLCFVRLYWDIRQRSGVTTQVADLLYQFVLGYTIDGLWIKKGYFVGIAWFFPLLVSSRLLYATLCKAVKEPLVIRGILCLMISGLGILLGKHIGRLPWSLDVAMAALPFVYMGNVAGKQPQFFENMYRKFWMMPVLLGIWLLLRNSFGYNELPTRQYPNGMTFLAVSFASMFLVMQIAYLVDAYLPKIAAVLGFYGKYSMAVLCVHILDKSCMVYPQDANIYLLLVWELFLASLPVIVMAVVKRYRKQMKG
jgi:fucose 4-O-acetylase-like acetyltransferase